MLVGGWWGVMGGEGKEVSLLLLGCAGLVVGSICSGSRRDGRTGSLLGWRNRARQDHTITNRRRCWSVPTPVWVAVDVH